jgi:hypothetical protein
MPFVMMTIYAIATRKYNDIDLAACDADTFKQRILLQHRGYKCSKQCQLYPNPTSNQLLLDKLPFDELFIFSLDGKQMDHFVAPLNEIDLTKYPSGMYFVKSVYNKKWSVTKIC